MASPGDGRRPHVTGLTHAPDGFPTQDPAQAAAALGRLSDKLALHRETIARWDAEGCADAEVIVVAIGIVARAARAAVRELRAAGVRAGLFRPVTLWPFPEEAFRAALDDSGARAVLVPEMNQGQLALEIERLAGGRARVARLNRFDGEPIAPDAIAAAAREALA